MTTHNRPRPAHEHPVWGPPRHCSLCGCNQEYHSTYEQTIDLFRALRISNLVAASYKSNPSNSCPASALTHGPLCGPGCRFLRCYGYRRVILDDHLQTLGKPCRGVVRPGRYAPGARSNCYRQPNIDVHLQCNRNCQYTSTFSVKYVHTMGIRGAWTEVVISQRTCAQGLFMKKFISYL